MCFHSVVFIDETVGCETYLAENGILFSTASTQTGNILKPPDSSVDSKGREIHWYEAREGMVRVNGFNPEFGVK